MSGFHIAIKKPIERLGLVNVYQIRGFLFLAALCLYAFLGSPTPDSPGFVEVFIAILLLASIGFSGLLFALSVDIKAPLWCSAGQVLLLYGLSVPVFMSIIQGHAVIQVLRDIFPFLFLLLPVFMNELCRRYPDIFRYILKGVLIIGIIFSVRAIIDIQYQIFNIQAGDELTYFENAPTVLFTSLFIIGYVGQYFIENFTFKAFMFFISGCVLTLLVLFPVALTAQRASLGYVVFYVFSLIVIAFYKAPYRAFVIVSIVVALLLPFYSVMELMFDTLLQKNALVGVNARFDELLKVWSEISKSLSTLAFGVGWGGSFESPAVAEVSVNYTHSLLSSALLKTGMIGVVLTVFYLLGLAKLLYGFLRCNPVLSLALAGTVFIDVFLYASFKSLDFGLVLLLISSYSFSQENVAKER